MPKAKKGEKCLGKRGMRGEKKGKELEERKVLRILLNHHGFKQVPPNMATGYRLGWQRLATGNLIREELVLATTLLMNSSQQSMASSQLVYL